MSLDPRFANLGDLRGLRTIALVVLDSLRWDNFSRGDMRSIPRYLPNQFKRFSYASWTQPSHTCLLAGLLPHCGSPEMPARTTYAADWAMWAHTLTRKGQVDQEFTETFSVAEVARRHGWRTIGRVAMPVLHERTQFSRGFDDYSLGPRGVSLGAHAATIGPSLTRERDFVFVNAGETHYPYLQEGLPVLSGLNGVFRAPGSEGRELDLSTENLNELKECQRKSLNAVDLHFSYLMDVVSKPALVMIVSDHGELFGEDGCFGHGPYVHRALFEVPLAVGLIS